MTCGDAVCLIYHTISMPTGAVQGRPKSHVCSLCLDLTDLHIPALYCSSTCLNPVVRDQRVGTWRVV